jgi:hypothetical protein
MHPSVRILFLVDGQILVRYWFAMITPAKHNENSAKRREQRSATAATTKWRFAKVII